MNTATIIFSAMAVSQFVFLAAHFAIHYRGHVSRLVVMFCLCAIAYLLDDSLNLAEGSLIYIVVGQLIPLAPFFLWLIASNLFVDERKRHALAWLAIALCYALDFYGALVYPEYAWDGSSIAIEYSFSVLPQLILLGFPLHAIYLAMHGYRTDLLEERRRFRIAFVAGLSVVVVFIVAGYILDDILRDGLIGGSEPYNMLASLCLFLVALAFNLGSIRSSIGALEIVSVNVSSQSEKATPAAATDNHDAHLVQAIERVMEEEQLYREPGLTISDLASRVGTPEYKARYIINRSMQYKNFNQFLNNYRIQEACGLIQTTKLPVSRVAMDVGYSSLSAFNRAFRERMDATPSDYRKQQEDRSARP